MYLTSAFFACILLLTKSQAQSIKTFEILRKANIFQPLEEIILDSHVTGTLSVIDSRSREYYRSPISGLLSFRAGGAPGTQTARLYDDKGKIVSEVTFTVEPKTDISDGGEFSELFKLLHEGMLVYSPKGYEEVSWRGKTYRYFVNWVLDNNNTARGMQYFSPYSRDLTDLLRENQKPDGMIWSFVQPDKNDFHYYETAYSYLGYFDRSDGVWFVRQPAENHVEYNYVNMMYQHWKASGDNEWMKTGLKCAMRALDFCVTDTLKWSKRYQLLRRPYCIDSWDFQVDDQYTPDAPLSPTMVVVPGKTKFGIFFGDNTGYFEACNQLAEMLDSARLKPEAEKYRKRAKEIFDRLVSLSWNGKFFTHFIDDDPLVKRDLGVDEKSQIAQGNMYSLNRGIPHEMCKSIIETYLDLRNKLPVGSPGEWYAIYPPFEKGFGMHDAKWQYMNGGIAGHAIGEMARGAYENGYEEYASDILLRTLKLIKMAGNRLWFAYTGSIPPPPPAPLFKAVDISSLANMDLWMTGGKDVLPWMGSTRSGNDMRGLPTGEQIFNKIRFNVIDPEKNHRRSVIGLSYSKGYPRSVEVPVNDNAGAVYLLHSSSDNTPSTFAGAITFRYTDGTEISRNIIKFRDVTNWWFSSLESERAGIAWAGPNPVSTRVGVCWAAIDNPEPAKKIDKLIFHAPIEGGIYAVIGISLADRPYYIKPKIESFGGPDNWASANAMAALVEGLAGVKNQGLAFSSTQLAPRWSSAGVDSVDVDIRFAASNGYVSYRYTNDVKSGVLNLLLTGSGNEINGHVLLPPGAKAFSSVTCDGKVVPFVISTVENSKYADFKIPLTKVHLVNIRYEK
jgi:hypothetical protein